MRIIYHFVLKSDWEKAPPGPYAPASLPVEGFIHCSNANQVERTSNKFYANATELLVLHLDASRVGELRDEGSGESYPHIYGAIPREAIVAVEELRRGPDGRWEFISSATPAPRGAGSDNR